MHDMPATHAERQVLGAMLQSETAVDAVLDTLTDRDFAVETHRQVWGGITRLITAGRPADPITVAEYLAKQPVTDDASSLQFLSDLAADCAAPANIRVYANIVRRHADERRLAEAGRAVTALSGGDAPIEDRIDLAQQTVMALSESTKTSPDARLVADGLSQYIEGLNNRYNKTGKGRGYQTGIPDLDRRLGDLMPGNLIVLAARPSVGKSVVAGQVAEWIAAHHGPVLSWSGEMSEDELNERTISRYSLIEIDRLQSGALSDEDWPRLTNAIQRLQELPLSVSERPAVTPMQLRVMARRVKRQSGGLAAIVVDYLQLMTMKSENRLEEVSAISRGLKALAKELHCVVIALSQLNRGLEARQNKRPMMSDLRESGQLEQDADKILMLYRGSLYGEHINGPEVMEINVVKNRGGKPGTVNVYWRGENALVQSGAPQDRIEQANSARPRPIYSGVSNQSGLAGIQ